MRDVFRPSFDFAARCLSYSPPHCSAPAGRARPVRRRGDGGTRRHALVDPARQQPRGDRAAARGARDPSTGQPGRGPRRRGTDPLRHRQSRAGTGERRGAAGGGHFAEDGRRGEQPRLLPRGDGCRLRPEAGSGRFHFETPKIAREGGRDMVDEHGGDAAGYLGWFFLGAIAGAAAALLLAPKTGSETRELLTEHGQEWFKKAQEKANEAQDKATDLIGKGRDYLEEQRTRLVGAFEAGRTAMKEEMGKLRSDT